MLYRAWHEFIAPPCKPCHGIRRVAFKKDDRMPMAGTLSKRLKVEGLASAHDLARALALQNEKMSIAFNRLVMIGWLNIMGQKPGQKIPPGGHGVP